MLISNKVWFLLSNLLNDSCSFYNWFLYEDNMKLPSAVFIPQPFDSGDIRYCGIQVMIFYTYTSPSSKILSVVYLKESECLLNITLCIINHIRNSNINPI